MSELSDIYSSSNIEGISLEHLQHIVPDDTPYITPFLSTSQQTFESVPNDRFLSPQLAPLAPESITRIKPDRVHEYLLYTISMSAEFVDWWLQTNYGRKKRINWDGRHQADCWAGFDQVANTKDGKPGVMCKRCQKVLDHPGTGHTGTSSMNKHLKGVNCQKMTLNKPNIQRLLEEAGQTNPAQVFSQKTWEQKLLNLITVSHLPFLFLEHQEFRDLLLYARLAPTLPTVPTRKVIRTRLSQFVAESQESTLQSLPSGGKLSIALDCWTSPFQQAFMAITGYFIDINWEYREVLLGFEPLSSTHSGANLGQVVVRILQQHKILDRVLAVTTDNASNNKTLVTTVNDAIQELKQNTESIIIQVPCLAHVIQLSLIDLLGKMKASPKNDTAELDWSEDRARLLRVQQEKRDIADTLNKVRSLAVYVNASPQRRDAFYNLQSKEPKLVPIQDVRTRWNSTYLMLRRAKRLQQTFNTFCSQYSQSHFALNSEEWQQIEYLLFILQPFFYYTSLVSRTKDSSIHLVFRIYNQLFDHLEKSIRQLRRKRVIWKQLMLSALEAAQEKLSKYYGMTDSIKGDLYAVGIILSPSRKLQFFSTKDWASDDPDKDYKQIYRASLQSFFETYSQRLSQDQPQLYSQKSTTSGIDIEAMDIESALDKDEQPEFSETSLQQHDELTQYLESGTIKETPRVFWKDHQHKFPILARLARDIMSVPATGAGVERLFNSARDICHYRRGSLKPTTVRDIMLFMCATRFDLQEQKRLILQEYFSHQELAAIAEANDSRVDFFDPISDTEEDTISISEVHPTLVVQLPLASNSGKRPRSVDDKGDQEARVGTEDDDDEVNLPLPNTQYRVSGRKRQRSRMLEGYIVEK